ncbi:MAG: tetratricopeptide repeat protein, partial [Ignavibacteria bacterium]|nr:tetratricopeptide repeat protein [Ignavibacteria bacterium]
VYLIKGNLDSAEIKFKKGIMLDSLAPDGYFQLATVYNMQGKKTQAVLMLEKLQTVAPNYKESAAILENLKKGENIGDGLIPENFDGGENSRNQRIKLLQSRSYQFYTEKKYEEAIKDLKELLKLNTDSSVKSGFLNNIAMCYSELKNEDAEERSFLEALSYDEKNLNALNGLAGFYMKTGDTEKSKIYLKKVIDLNPADENSIRKLDSLNSF